MAFFIQLKELHKFFSPPPQKKGGHLLGIVSRIVNCTVAFKENFSLNLVLILRAVWPTSSRINHNG